MLADIKLIAEYLQNKGIEPLNVEWNHQFHKLHEGYSSMDLCEYTNSDLSIHRSKDNKNILEISETVYKLIDVRTKEIVLTSARQDIISKKLDKLRAQANSSGIRVIDNEFSDFDNQMVYPYTVDTFWKTYKINIHDIDKSMCNCDIILRGYANVDTVEQHLGIYNDSDLGIQQTIYDTVRENINLTIPNVFYDTKDKVKIRKGIFKTEKRQKLLSDYLGLE